MITGLGCGLSITGRPIGTYLLWRLTGRGYDGLCLGGERPNTYEGGHESGAPRYSYL
jgi:hypothetical protein